MSSWMCIINHILFNGDNLSLSIFFFLKKNPYLPKLASRVQYSATSRQSLISL